MSSVLVAGDWHLASVTVAGLLELGYQIGVLACDQGAFGEFAAGERAANEPGTAKILDRARVDGSLFPVIGDDAMRTAACDSALSVVAYDSRTRADGTVVDLRPARTAALLLAATGGSRPVVLTSQVRVGTSDEVLRTVGLAPDTDALVHMPENLRLGQGIEDFLRPHRLVAGCNAPVLPESVRELLTHFAAGVVVRVSLVEAELVKHGTNAYLAMCITLANDIGTISGCLGADPVRVMDGVRADARVAVNAPLQPGAAYAGATLQRDVMALWEAGAPIGRDGLFRAISRANAVHALEPLALLDRCLDGLSDRRICLLGLTYKPGVSTLRDSPAALIANELAAHGCAVTAFDPVAEDTELMGVSRCADLQEAVLGADCVVLTVEHDAFAGVVGPGLGDTSPRRRLLVRTGVRERDSRVPTPDGWTSVDLWQS